VGAKHPLIGEKICSSLGFAAEVGPMIRRPPAPPRVILSRSEESSPPERQTGSETTPNALAGDEIPLMARVLSVVDSFDAMTSDRPYRAALPLAEAVRRLRDGAGTQWDPNLVQTFTEKSPALGQESQARSPARATDIRGTGKVSG